MGTLIMVGHDDTLRTSTGQLFFVIRCSKTKFVAGVSNGSQSWGTLWRRPGALWVPNVWTKRDLRKVLIFSSRFGSGACTNARIWCFAAWHCARPARSCFSPGDKKHAHMSSAKKAYVELRKSTYRAHARYSGLAEARR